MIRNSVKFVIAISLIILVFFYFLNQKFESIKSDSFMPTEVPTEQVANFWVITMFNDIGTFFVSEVISLPVDETESVAIAANGWGKEKLKTIEKNVYKFSDLKEAENFRREKGGAELNLTADQLKKYLCLGQTPLPTKDYWVFIAHYYDESEFISEVFPLPSYDNKIIKAAAHWGPPKGTVKGYMMFEIKDTDFYKFNNQAEAEKFRQEKGLPDWNFSLIRLKKCLCVEQIRNSEEKKNVL